MLQKLQILFSLIFIKYWMQFFETFLYIYFLFAFSVNCIFQRHNFRSVYFCPSLGCINDFKLFAIFLTILNILIVPLQIHFKIASGWHFFFYISRNHYRMRCVYCLHFFLKSSICMRLIPCQRQILPYQNNRINSYHKC